MEGSEIVTTIWGPWNEPYLRDLQGTEEFVFDSNHDPTEALANKRMYIVDKNVNSNPLHGVIHNMSGQKIPVGRPYGGV